MLLTNAQTRLAWIVIYEGISSNLSHDPVPVPLLTLVQQRASGFLPVAMKTYERLRCCCLWQELEAIIPQDTLSQPRERGGVKNGPFPFTLAAIASPSPSSSTSPAIVQRP
uniref:(northern house mosquito) hypothetical protein n=1 Tax=Culex pipiens TaxID=7175 RepID=A0A8D8IZY9_CULPI